MSTPSQLSPAGVCVRTADFADLPIIAALAAKIWRACYPGIISPAQIDYMLRRMYSLETLATELREGIVYDCLFFEESMIGFAARGPAREQGVFKLHKLYVHPDWQNRGLGSVLLRHCEAKVQSLGASRLVLNVNRSNSNAIRAYQRNGFAIAESVVADIGGGFVMDDYVMAKELHTC